MRYNDVNYTSINAVVKTFIEGFDIQRSVNLIIVGANNGDIPDFLGKWVGQVGVNSVLVEPLTHLFTELEEKYRRKANVRLENAALDSMTGEKEMYFIENKTKNLPDWCTGLGSFSKSTVLNHSNQVKNIESHISCEQVRCINFSELLQKHSIEQVDILQVDTEGNDYEILSGIDINLYRPSIVIAEYLHMSFYQYYAIITQLQDNDYTVCKAYESLDLIAIHNSCL